MRIRFFGDTHRSYGFMEKLIRRINENESSRLGFWEQPWLWQLPFLRRTPQL